MSSNGWIGVDLDGTLAHYDKWIGIEHIGEPIPLMVQRVKNWLKNNQKVKIFTARIAVDEPGKSKVLKYIKDWCLKHIGQELEVTNVKDMQMTFLFDDRAVQIEKNTGQRIDKEDYCNKCNNTGFYQLHPEYKLIKNIYCSCIHAEILYE